MDLQDCPFLIAYQPERQGHAQLLGCTPDTNAASVAAHRELWLSAREGDNTPRLIVAS